jgi:hypothetical protein
MKESAAIAFMCAVAYLFFGLVASAFASGIVLWLLGGLCLWLTFRIAYAVEDGE